MGQSAKEKSDTNTYQYQTAVGTMPEPEPHHQLPKKNVITSIG
uniref:Uncharacterized protein n=1 Tax=Vibrio parahaemolyticus TaxID=670 RepID=A0A0C5GWU6_VIBPH|nr:hypothetical protein pVPH1_0006 [Vibrio parahaemolyticus]